jgi:hypothetical protein
VASQQQAPLSSVGLPPAARRRQLWCRNPDRRRPAAMGYAGPGAQLARPARARADRRLNTNQPVADSLAPVAGFGFVGAAAAAAHH